MIVHKADSDTVRFVLTGELKMKKIALDVGDKTIGVAVSDALNITAQGITTIERVGIRKDAGKVMDLIR